MSGLLGASGVERDRAVESFLATRFTLMTRHCSPPRPPNLPIHSWLCVLLLALAPVLAQAADPRGTQCRDDSGDSELSGVQATTIPFVEYRLANGLQVILHHDASLPLVAVNVWYHVGPVNEPKGRSGFAHLFEHLMFEGSKHVGPNFDRYLEAAGASNVNGTTSFDRTNYFETVPPEHLELALWLESDRMGFLHTALTQERFDVQREVVKNERRQSYENAPYGPSALTLFETLFPPGHPYRGAIIGSVADLDAASLDDAREFFERYYAPSNATLTLAGAFDEITARAWIDRYFGSLRRVPRPPPGTTGELLLPPARHVEVAEPVDVAKVTFAWLAAPAYGIDHAPLVITTELLAGGRSARLYRTLVKEQRLATEVSADFDGYARCSLVTIDALVSSSATTEAVERGITAELERLAQSGPTAAELSRAKRRILLSQASDLALLNGPSGSSGRAGWLQEFNHYLGAPGALDTFRASLLRVTAADVRRVVSSVLGVQHRTILVTVPAGKGARS